MVARNLVVMKRLILAVPIIIALVVAAGPTEACAGGDDGKTYMDEHFDVKAGEKGSIEFQGTMDLGANVDKHGGGVMYILTEDQFINYTEGKNFTHVYQLNHTVEEGDWIRLEHQRTYHAIIDNTQGTEDTSGYVYIAQPGSKCGPDHDTFFLPGFEAGFGLASLVIVASVLALIGRR